MRKISLDAATRLAAISRGQNAIAASSMLSADTRETLRWRLHRRRVDTFLIRDGKLVAKTVYYTVNKGGALS